MDGDSDPVRAVPLLREGQDHASRYWRAGPGSAAAVGHLNAAVKVLDEAYGYLEPGDLLRGQVAATLGWLIGMRYTAHAGADRDRETGIHLLEEAVAFTDLPRMQAGVARLVLGQLYLSRVTAAFKDNGFAMAALRGGAPSSASADADRAVKCLSQVFDEKPFSAELTASAEAMLKMAEAMSSLMGGFGAGPGGVDLGGMMEALNMLQNLQHRAATGGFGPHEPGLPPMPSFFFDADRIATADPLDRPVAVLRGDGPATSGLAHPRTPVAMNVIALRRELPSVTALLDASAVPDLDAIVATASTIVHSGSIEPSDHLRLAAALCLRDQRGDGDGWGDDSDGDRRAAVDQLRAAADPNLPAAHVPAMLRLAVALDALDAAASRFGSAAQALRAVDADALLFPGLAWLDASTGELRPAGTLPARVLVVGPTPVPPQDAIVSYVPSDTALVDIARRTVPLITACPVFVANPRGDRDALTMEAVVLRRSFYSRSTGLGNTGEQVDGAGTPDEVLAHLDASLLHLGCGITAAGALELADGATLAAKRMAAAGTGAGGLAIASPADAGFPALAEALLTAGFTGVIGWLREVPPPVAAAANLMLHASLVDDGLSPAHAVHEVQRWLRAPDRVARAYLPSGYASAADLANERWWSALVHWGR